MQPVQPVQRGQRGQRGQPASTGQCFSPVASVPRGQSIQPAVATPDSGFDEPERRLAVVFGFFPYVMLAVGLLLNLLTEQPPAGSLLITLAVAAGAALWVLWWVTLHPGWENRRALMAVYFTGLIGFGVVLLIRSPWFAFFAWIGFIHAFRFLHGRWRYLGIAATALEMAIAQGTGFHTLTLGLAATYLALACLNAGLMLAFSRLSQVTTEQNQARKQMIAELAEANHRLENTVAENRSLHAQLVEQAREAGITEERQRMAREIHDTLAQGLAGIVTQLEAAGLASEHSVLAETRANGHVNGRETGHGDRRETGHGDGGEAGRGESGTVESGTVESGTIESGTGASGQREMNRHLQNARQLARDSLAEARRSVHALRPAALETARLPEALAAETHTWSSVNDVTAQMTCTGTSRPLHPDAEIALLRVAQEALANVAKHARASRVGLTLSYMEDVVTLDVRDDGVGFVAAGLAHSGPGLAQNSAGLAQNSAGLAQNSAGLGRNGAGLGRINGGADGATYPAAPGAHGGGFGLTAMRQRVEGLAGRLEIESEAGLGTAVSATVPAIPPGEGA